MIEDFDETHLCKLCVILRPRLFLEVCHSDQQVLVCRPCQDSNGPNPKLLLTVEGSTRNLLTSVTSGVPSKTYEEKT